MKYYRILLVDDEPHIINMIMRLLDSIENMELDIYYAYSAVDALDIIKKGRIDLLITDIQMPGMNGLELLQQINLFWSGTKSIVLTAYPEFHYAYEVFQQNASGYLLKTEEYIQKIGIDVKVARRDFLPKFTLYGQAGFNAYSLSNIFGSHTFKALAGVMPSLDLFTGGAKIAHLRYSKLEYEKAQQMYEKTILTSLQEVNDSLSNAIKSRKNLDMSSERNSLEKDKYQLMLRRKEIGALSDLDLLRAEENLILADKDEASNKINYIISTINIYKAVGGTDYMQYAENI